MCVLKKVCTYFSKYVHFITVHKGTKGNPTTLTWWHFVTGKKTRVVVEAFKGKI